MNMKLLHLFLTVFTLNAITFSNGYGMESSKPIDIPIIRSYSPVLDHWIVNSNSDSSLDEEMVNEDNKSPEIVLYRALEFCDEYKQFLIDGIKILCKEAGLKTQKRKHTRKKNNRTSKDKYLLITNGDKSSNVKASFNFLSDAESTFFFTSMKEKHLSEDDEKLIPGLLQELETTIKELNLIKTERRKNAYTFERSLKSTTRKTIYTTMDLVEYIHKLETQLKTEIDKTES